MREFERIGRIMKLIETIWDDAPDMRFGQLLENIMRNSENPDRLDWFLEDVKFEKILREHTWNYDAVTERQIKSAQKSLKDNGGIKIQ